MGIVIPMDTPISIMTPSGCEPKSIGAVHNKDCVTDRNMDYENITAGDGTCLITGPI